MKTATTIELDEGDVELLSKVLPDNPCHKCSEVGSCSGCQEKDDYNKTLKIYEDRNILEQAENIKRVSIALRTADDAKNKLDKLNSKYRGLLISVYGVDPKFYVSSSDIISISEVIFHQSKTSADFVKVLQDNCT